MSVIRLAWLLVLLCLSGLAGADDRRPEVRRLLVRHRRRWHAHRPAVLLLLAHLPALPGGQAVHRRTPGPESVARGQALLGEGSPRQCQVLLRDGADARRRGALGARLRVLPPDHHRLRLGRDDGQATRRRIAGLPRPTRSRIPVHPILRRRRWRQRRRRHDAALGGRGERRHDGQPAVHRPGGRQGVLAARCSRWCSRAWMRSIPAHSSCCCSCSACWSTPGAARAWRSSAARSCCSPGSSISCSWPRGSTSS